MNLLGKAKQTEINNISPLQADEEAKKRLYAQPEAAPEPAENSVAPANSANPTPQDMKPPTPAPSANPIVPTSPSNPASQAMTPPTPPAPVTPQNMPPSGMAEPSSRFSALRESLGMRAESPRQIGMTARPDVNMAPSMSLGRSNQSPPPVQNITTPTNQIASNPSTTRAADQLSRASRMIRPAFRTARTMQQSIKNMKKVRK